MLRVATGSGGLGSSADAFECMSELDPSLVIADMLIQPFISESLE